MKKIWYGIFSLLLFLVGSRLVYGRELDISSNNVILYRLKDEQILYEKNAYERISIASMTKIMTAVVVLEQVNSLDDTITLTEEDFKGLKEANASMAGFQVGQVVTYRDLLYGLLLPSGAEAALSLARNVGGTRENFIGMMNEKAQELKLDNTHFENETGLDQENHYSTVYEVAKLFRYALKNEDFFKIVTSSNYTSSDGTVSMKSTLFGMRDAFHISADYLQGGKTGTTSNAGVCLASIAHLSGEDFLLVSARAFYNGAYRPLHIYDAKTVYEYFDENYQEQVVIEKGENLVTLNTKYFKQKNITFSSKEQIVSYLPKTFQKSDVTLEYIGISEITIKQRKGDLLGVVKIHYQDKIIDTVDIYLEENLEIDFVSYLKDHIREVTFIIAEMILVILSFVIFKKNVFVKR